MDQTTYVRVDPPPPYAGNNPPVIVQQANPQPQTVIVVQPDPYLYDAGTGPVIGRCPKCQVGVVRLNFTLIGILWGILCFPCGIICCLSMRDRQCGHCGQHYNR